MQFPSEFEWLSPDGGGLLTSYMRKQYAAGWVTHSAASLEAAEQAAFEKFRQLAPVAAARNVLLPVGSDHVIPSRWVTGIHRDWNSRYVWPRFAIAVPSEFFAAVRKDAAERDVWITPQTRDMNPVYTGKDVSYIDTKQAQRAAETAVLDGQRLATPPWPAGRGGGGGGAPPRAGAVPGRGGGPWPAGARPSGAGAGRALASGPPPPGPAAARAARGPATTGPATTDGGWTPADGAVIENGAFLVEADPERGGTLTRVLDKRSGTELLTGAGNDLVIQEEYAHHPRWGEGPWLLTPKGQGRGSAGLAARVRAERCPIGAPLVAELDFDDLRVTQETLLWEGADRVEFRTHVDGSIGKDRLLRGRFPARGPGGLPVYQTALAVIGRPFGSARPHLAQHEFTLDNPAHEWFGLGSTARVGLSGPASGRFRAPPRMHAIGVADVITPNSHNRCPAPIPDLILALSPA